jgi:hypothetical protein
MFPGVDASTFSPTVGHGPEASVSSHVHEIPAFTGHVAFGEYSATQSTYMDSGAVGHS